MYTANVSELQEKLVSEKPPKPQSLPVIIGNIPEESQRLPRWVLWRRELRKDSQGQLQWSKVPVSGKLGEADEHWWPGKSNDPKTWTSFKEVVQHLRDFDGLGFMLGDGFSGVDLDKCRDPLTGYINDQAMQIIKELQSYTEVSPSGTGVKILVKAEKPAGRCRIGNFEMYSESRYFTITGHHLEGTPTTIEPRQEEVNRLHARMFPPQNNPSRNGKCNHAATGVDEDDVADAEIIAAAKNAKNGEKFSKLWNGDWQTLGYPSQSEADEALVGMLAFWCGPSSDRIDQMFRRSGLYRDKWERPDYRDRTIDRVLESQEEYFHWGDHDFHDLELQAEGIVQAVEVNPSNGKLKRKTSVVDTTEVDGEKKAKDAFHFQRLAEKFLEESGLIFQKYRDKMYAYQETRYIEELELADKLRRFLLRNRIPHNNNLIGNVAPIIGSIVFKSSADYPAMPFHIGKQECKPENLIAYRNGILDLEKFLDGDNSLLPHTPKWVSTVCLPYAFDPCANCPQWEAFLAQVFEGDQDRTSLLQEWFGYCLMHDTTQHKLMILTGVPRSGKGTTMRVLEALVGDENSAGYNLHSLADKFGLRKLVGKLVAFVGEVNLANSRDKYRILETLNSIVGEDKVDVEEKFKPEGMSQKLPVRFVIACNDMPNFVDPSGALAARLLLLNYAVSYDGREDRGLEKKLLTEVSGISNWALSGYARLRRNGTFTVPAKSKALVNEFRRENSDAYAFMQDCLVVESQLNPGNFGNVRFTDKPVWVTSKKLEECYLQWCGDNNIDHPSMKWLGRNLKTILPKLREERRMEGGKRERVYFGIGLFDSSNGIPLVSPVPKPVAAGEISTESQFEEFFARIKA